MTRTFKLTDTNRQPVREWPLRFDSHSFSVFTYDTSGARVNYAGEQQIAQDEETLQQSSASYGPDYQKNWHGIHGMIRNFPAPAKVSWRSKNGELHAANIDFGQIFEDQIIRHNMSRGEMSEMPNGQYNSEPSIILEINDRTIRVYMRAMIYTKDLQIPGNVYSGFRHDLVLADTFVY